MKIRKMKADFGVLSGSELELHDGLNIISAPNESGKSTWCAFICAMLYGIDSSQREKGGKKPDKVKYAPWSGVPMSGVMDIVHGGEEITLTRRTKSAASPMKDFSAVYTGTGTKVPGLTGQNAGETLIGVSRSTFERSAFIRQSNLTVSGSPDLEKRIAAIVSSGEEETSFSEAEARLRAWQRKRRFNRSGAIPALEGEISALRTRLNEQRAAGEQARQLEEAVLQTERQLADAANRDEEARKARKQVTLNKLNSAREEFSRTQALSRAAAELFAQSQAELNASVFGSMTPEEAMARAKADAEAADRCRELSLTKNSRLGWILPSALGVIMLLAAIFLPFLAAAGALALAAATRCFVRWRKNRVSAENAAKERQAILDSYGTSDSAGILALAEEHSALWRKAQSLRAEAEAARERAEKASNDLRRLENETLDRLDSSDYGSQESDAIRERLSRLKQERDIAAGRLEVLGDPVVMETELSALTSRLEELTCQYNALDLAIDTLRQADIQMQSRFSPLLAKRASELFSRLTGGRYDRLLLTREFSASAHRQGDTLDRDMDFLSQGTYDQLYLALRLAICQLALPDDDPCPLVLDDALINFDSGRSALAMELLEEMAKTRQIIFFTCR